MDTPKDMTKGVLMDTPKGVLMDTPKDMTKEVPMVILLDIQAGILREAKTCSIIYLTGLQTLGVSIHHIEDTSTSGCGLMTRITLATRAWFETPNTGIGGVLPKFRLVSIIRTWGYSDRL